MIKLLHCFYNMDSNSVEVTFSDGSVLTIDCEEVENHYDVTNGQMADLDWLLYNAPMEYASLVLSGEMENYLKGPALHGMEDQIVCRCIAKTRYTDSCFLFLIYAIKTERAGRYCQR